MFKNSLSLIVFKKENLESIRDKRVILGVIVSPLLVTPLFDGNNFLLRWQRAIEKSQATLDIGIVEQHPFPELTNWLEDDETINISNFPSREELRKQFEAEQFERR